jgi:hypothetical protein
VIAKRWRQLSHPARINFNDYSKNAGIDGTSDAAVVSDPLA